MSQFVKEVFSGRINTPYHLLSPFAEERARYLAHLLDQGWSRFTVIGIACKLVAFATRVDITAEGGIGPDQIAAAADDWMQQPRPYRQAIGPYKSRTSFVYAATGWLKFLGCFREPATAPHPFAHLVADFTRFLDHERGLSPATIKIRRDHLLAFLSWFALQQRPFSQLSVQDVERFLALPRPRPWSRVTAAGFIASMRGFLRYAASRQWCAPNLAESLDAPRLYTLDGLPAGPSWASAQAFARPGMQNHSTPSAGFLQGDGGCCCR